jgi:Protein of unknown function (DUF3866)
VHLRVGLEDGEERTAISYPALTGPVEPGDEVIVNVEAQDLGLGSGGFDVVHVNVSQLPAAEQAGEAHVIKLNYTPLQHTVEPLEQGLEQVERPLGTPAGVLALHGQLAPAAFALAQRRPGTRCGYVQTAGGALPGALSDTVALLLERGLLSDHATVAPCFGGPLEAITIEGALHAGAVSRNWDCTLVGPGPGILGSASALGHGGMAALAGAHGALSLGCEVVMAPRLSSGDSRPRHRGLSHHTRTVLALLLAPVGVAVPTPVTQGVGAALEEALAGGPHRAEPADVADLLVAYARSGLPARTMGRSIEEDPDFFSAGLAAGAVLAAALD